MKWPLQAISGLLLCLVMASCTTPQSGEKEKLFADIPAGSILKVNLPLAIPANEARVILQYGKQISPSQLDTWESHCQFITWTLSSEKRQIQQTDFRITRVTRGEERFISSVSYAWLIKTSMNLESNKYHDIFLLVCGQVWDGASSRRLYLSEFKEAVGEYITIQLPEKLERLLASVLLKYWR